jgi:uncharacterized protein (TIGR02147 family)
MTILDFEEYRDFIRYRLRGLPLRGRGEMSNIAKSLRMNATWLSQIMSGSRQFTVDQALELGALWQLSSTEIEYFILLVQLERSATHKAKLFFRKKIDTLKTENSKLQNQVPHERQFDEKEKAIFYSSWLYSAIHLYTSTKKDGVTIEEILSHFEIHRVRAINILTFLVQSELCFKNENRYSPTTLSTFVDRESPHFLKHHSNWRIRAIEKAERLSDEEVMFTAPVSIAREDFPSVQKELVRCIKTISGIVKDSNADSVAALNIDWFLVGEK